MGTCDRAAMAAGSSGVAVGRLVGVRVGRLVGVEGAMVRGTAGVDVEFAAAETRAPCVVVAAGA